MVLNTLLPPPHTPPPSQPSASPCVTHCFLLWRSNLWGPDYWIIVLILETVSSTPKRDQLRPTDRHVRGLCSLRWISSIVIQSTESEALENQQLVHFLSCRYAETVPRHRLWAACPSVQRLCHFVDWHHLCIRMCVTCWGLHRGGQSTQLHYWVQVQKLQVKYYSSTSESCSVKLLPELVMHSSTFWKKGMFIWRTLLHF